jgi:copper ion binding protein
MKHLLIAGAAALVVAIVPTSAVACGCCDHDHHAGHHSTGATTAKLGPGEARVEIPVSGMHCGHCATRVETAVQKLDGVKTAEVRLDDGKVVVVFDKSKVAVPKIVETIDALGFKAGAPVQG